MKQKKNTSEYNTENLCWANVIKRVRKIVQLKIAKIVLVKWK